jgi:precorrin-6A/cobalt-precorrin-6A reductase
MQTVVRTLHERNAMILLLGGTSETAEISTALAAAGWKVLVSTATDVELDVGAHPNIARRIGTLDEAAMERLVLEAGVRAIVDATHPYAAAAHVTVAKVAQETGIPCLRWQRPEASTKGHVVRFADDHEQAAVFAASAGKPILMTIGSTNLALYVREANRTGALLIARVLDRAESVEAALAAGVPEQHIIQGRGPFSVEENRALIGEFSIAVIVTKDSGEAGGVPAKFEAARHEGCQVVVVRRPEEAGCPAYRNVKDLLKAALQALQGTRPASDGE